MKGYSPQWTTPLKGTTNDDGSHFSQCFLASPTPTITITKLLVGEAAELIIRGDFNKCEVTRDTIIQLWHNFRDFLLQFIKYCLQNNKEY